MSPRLETDRLVLEPLTADHADALWEPMQDPRIWTWIGAEPPPDRDGLRRRWARVAADARSLGWAVRERDGGWVGKMDAVVDGTVATNVGYLFFPSAWGRGIATEAVRAVVQYLDGLGVTEQRASVTRGNDASVRVLEKAGFGFDRVVPDAEQIRGVWHDDLAFVRSYSPAPHSR